MPFVRSEAKIMEDIRNSLAIANNESASESERESARGRANRLIARHAIDQAMIDASRTTGERRVPTSMKIELWDRTFEWADHFTTILAELARTNRCKIVIHSGRQVHITIVGMQEDVEWTQLIWMQIFYEFVSKISPRWDNKKTMGENVMVFKEAGFKWEDIWRNYFHAVDGKTRDGLDHYDAKKASYLISEYKKWLNFINRPAVATARFAAYRASFVASFSNRVSTRLEEMRAAAKKEQDSVPGSALALTDVSGLIDEEYFRLFPDLRPMSREDYAEYLEQLQKQDRVAKAKDDEFLSSLSAPERKRVLGEREAEKRRQARTNDRYWREQDRASRRLHDDAGFKAGRSAAEQVNLSRAKAAGAPSRKGEIG